MGHQRLAATAWLVDPHPLGGTGVVCTVGCQWQATNTGPTLLSSRLPLCLLMMFCFTGFGHQWPTSNHHSADSRVSCQPSITGWIVSVGLLCADPPHDYQWSASQPLDVIWWPPLPPPYRHSLLGGQLHMPKKCL